LGLAGDWPWLAARRGFASPRRMCSPEAKPASRGLASGLGLGARLKMWLLGLRIS
jgi:hypothetical protein